MTYDRNFNLDGDRSRQTPFVFRTNRRHLDGFTMAQVILGAVFVVLLIARPFAMNSLVSSDSAIQVASRAGFVNPAVVARHNFAPVFHGCGKDDAVAFDMTGVNQAGQSVSFTVCSGWPFKRGTIRY